MHILQVVEPGKDGVFRHVEGLCDFLLSRGDTRVSLAYSDVRASDRLPVLVDRIRASGSSTVNLQVGNIPQAADFRAFFRLLRFCWRERPDVIHAHSSKAGALARLLRFGGVTAPIVYTPNAYFGMSSRKNAVTAIFNTAERLLSRIGYTINVSSDEAEFARTRLGVPRERQFLIFNAIDTQAFRRPSPEERRSARAQFGLPETAVVIGCVARDSFQKNLQLLYQAVATVMAQRPETWLLHVGEGDMSELTRNLGIASRVRREIYLADTVPFYHAIDAFAMSSRYEGLSFAIIEALGTNRPIIVTAVPGNREFLSLALSHAWSAPNEDGPAFAGAIEACLKDFPANRHCNHQEVARAQFSYEACYGAICRTYELLVAAEKDTSPGSLQKPGAGAGTADIHLSAERSPVPGLPESLHRLIRLASLTAIVCGVGIASYLCLRTRPGVADIRWLPASLTHWADYHGRVRNIPAFAVLALPFMLICPSPRARRTAIFGLAAFAATLELLQYFIPTRYCEWQDIACSWIGLALTWVSFEFASWAAWRIYRSFPRR